MFNSPVFVEENNLQLIYTLLPHTEYAAINTMLDQINSCLDDLEERNDALNGKLHELLESNRQARQEFRAKMHEDLAAGQQHADTQQISGENPAPPEEKENQ